jgi:hypothetical protein
VHGNHFTDNLSLGEKHFENIVPEDDLYLFQFQRRSDAKHAAVGYENVAVRIESKGIAKRLHSDDGAGDGIIFRNRMLEKNLQGFPGAAAQIGKKLPIVEKRTAEDFRYAEYEMPVRNLLEDIHAEPLPEFHYALLIP